MKKSIMIIVLFIGIIACISGCVVDNHNEDMNIDENNIAEEAYLTLSLNESRTVLPQSLDQTTLTYTLVGRYEETNHQLGVWTYSDMLASRIELIFGQWDFTLTASDGNQNVLVGSITNQRIVGGENQLVFTMKEYNVGTGSISITVLMPHGTVAKAEAVLKDASDDTFVDSQILTIIECTGDATQDYALYELNPIDKGYYTLLLKLYQSENDTECINQQITLVRVEPGCPSLGRVIFENVNTFWNIIYHFEDFDVTNDAVLPTRYNKSMRISFPNSYTINGEPYYIRYYNNEDRTGDKISEISYGNNGDIELWVKSKYGIPVSSSNFYYTPGHYSSSGGPYTFIITDNNPNMNRIHSGLSTYPNVKVNLDMSECMGLTSISSNSLYSFKDCTGLTSIVLPSSVQSIGSSAFSGCTGLMSIEIPEGVASIDSCVFSGCSSLTSIVLPSSVQSIGSSAFQNCAGLTRLEIPESVTSINEGAFKGCSGLESITIPFVGLSPNDNTCFYRIFGNSGSEDVPTSLKEVVIADGARSISDEAFGSCRSLTSITIPNSVTSIGYMTLRGCTGLERITIGYIDKLYILFGSNASAVPTSLKEVVITGDVTSICNNAFEDCSGLTSIILPESVTSIGYNAFKGCSELHSINIPESVTSIGNYAFRGCKGLTEPVYNTHIFARLPTSYSGSYEIPSSITYIVGSAFESCKGLTSIKIPESVTTIGDCVFCDCDGLRSVTIPGSVKRINSWTFENCSLLESVTILDGVEDIDQAAFKDCERLTSVTIPDSVTYISLNAFTYCISLTSIMIPNSVTGLGTSAFSWCTSLTTMIVKATTPPHWGTYVFDGCSALTTIYVPSESVDAYKMADGWKTYADIITVGDF